MAELSILDVGHGNCAVLCLERSVVVIDSARGDTLLEFLAQRGATVVDAVLISHADGDHVAGVLALLSQREIAVRALYLNPDALRRTAMWTDLKVAIRDARSRGQVEVHVELTTSSKLELDSDGVRVEVLAPTPELAVAGVGGRDLHGRPVTANAMSAVIRVVSNGQPEVVLPGDLDAIGLDNLLAEYPEPRGRVLVFPHHGGRPGSADATEFAARLCRAVAPSVVVFSIGRGQHNTPLPEIVKGVRGSAPSAHIACTELSTQCAAAPPDRTPPHLGDRVSRGRGRNACCAGTFHVTLGGPHPLYAPGLDAHRAFVERQAPTALCGRVWNLEGADQE